MATSYKVNMNWDQFNALMNPQNATMKLIAARSLLNDVQATFTRFANEDEPELMALRIKLSKMIDNQKELAAQRRKALEKAETTTPATLDNPTGEQTHITDVQAKYSEVAAAKAEGVI